MATDQTSIRATDGSSSSQAPATAAQQRATEHAGTTDTDVLASDIAQTREELAVTIDAIVDRVSPKKVVERGKQQAREGVAEATEVVKAHATTAAGVVREKAIVASGVVKEKVAEVKEKVSGSPDGAAVTSSATSSRRLTGATTVSSPDAGPVSSPGAAADAAPASSPGASPLPAGTVSVDAGALPPPEPGAVPAGTSATDVPAHRPLTTAGSGSAPVPPAYAGAAAALLATLLLLLRRRRSRRRRLVSR